MKVFICVDNSGADKCLTLGKTYAGEWRNGETIRAIDDRGVNTIFFAERFEETSLLLGEGLYHKQKECMMSDIRDYFENIFPEALISVKGVRKAQKEWESFLKNSSLKDPLQKTVEEDSKPIAPWHFKVQVEGWDVDVYFCFSGKEIYIGSFQE